MERNWKEKLIFTQKKDSKKKSIVTKETTNFSGLMGGINFLISKKFLDSPKSVKDVMNELKKEGYFYLNGSIDKILRVDFVNKKKILTRISENNVWRYVVRK